MFEIDSSTVAQTVKPEPAFRKGARHARHPRAVPAPAPKAKPTMPEHLRGLSLAEIGMRTVVEARQSDAALSHAEWGELTGVSEAKAKRLLAGLRQAGAIEVVQHRSGARQSASSYRVLTGQTGPSHALPGGKELTPQNGASQTVTSEPLTSQTGASQTVTSEPLTSIRTMQPVTGEPLASSTVPRGRDSSIDRSSMRKEEEREPSSSSSGRGVVEAGPAAEILDADDDDGRSDLDLRLALGVLAKQGDVEAILVLGDFTRAKALRLLAQRPPPSCAAPPPGGPTDEELISRLRQCEASGSIVAADLLAQVDGGQPLARRSALRLLETFRPTRIRWADDLDAEPEPEPEPEPYEPPTAERREQLEAISRMVQNGLPR